MQLLPFLRLGSALLASPALPGAALAQSAASPATTPAAASPLATARTVQVHETLRRAGSDGKMPPAYSVDVTIQKPDKIKIVIASPQNKRPDLYVRDGKTEYQYDGRTNKYRADPLPASGQAAAQVSSSTMAEFLLTGGQISPLSAGTTRTIGSEIVGGKRMNTWTDTQTVGGAGAKAVKLAGEMWIDAKTHLPYRLLVTITRAGVATPYQDLIFSGWKFNQPLPAARLAWTPPAGSVLFKMEASGLLAVGTPAPDFTATAPDGRKVHLPDYKGKTVVLDFWATWCGPCQKSMPELEKVYQQVKDKDVVVLGLCSWDQKGAYDKWLMTTGTAYTFQTAYDPAGHDTNSIAGSLYKVSAIPTQYVIDKDGKIAAAYVGYDDGDTRLEKALAAQGVTVQPVAAAAVTKAP